MSESAAVDRTAGSIGLVTRSWRADATQLRGIRAQVRCWLAPFGLTGDDVHDVVLAADEAVSNVVVHAYSPGTVGGTVEVALRCESDTLVIEVSDYGRWRRPSFDSTRHRRGIAVMNRLMGAVLIRYDLRGTCVVLRYPLR